MHPGALLVSALVVLTVASPMRFLRFPAAVLAFLIVGILVPQRSAWAQSESPKHEMRAAWMATVANLDWPTNKFMTTQQKKDELLRSLDGLQAAGINAVIFQVRDEADALYASSFEPWSYFLTGVQGQAPDPYFDPLEFAVEEAHRRGMELHAWFNPYRVWVSSRDYPRDTSHVLLKRPEWLLEVGSVKILDPGIPDVRQYVIDVVMDVATRYDVDGIHFDDYFYPYPPNQMQNEDRDTFTQYRGSFTTIEVWREFNTNMLVRGVWEALQAQAPHVKFGISPFGIWRSGVPSGIIGLSAKDAVHADAVNWMQQEWLDYLTPQLYWAFGGGQDYAKLAPWWASQANGRHIYTGHGLYRSDASTYSGTLFSEHEVPNQVRFNRATEGIQGSVFFRSRNVTDFRSRGFADTLRTDLFRYPALTPSIPWKSQDQADPVEGLQAVWASNGVTVSWDASVSGAVRTYAVYRVVSELEPSWEEAMPRAENLLAVTGETSLVDAAATGVGPYHYMVTAVSVNSVESPPSVPARVVSTDPAVVARAELEVEVWPNPFHDRLNVLVSSDAGSVSVYDVLGRRVASIPGDGSSRFWDGRDTAGRALPTGTYFVVVEGRRGRAVRSVVKGF